MFIQCNEEVLKAICARAVEKGCSINLSEKTGELFVEEQEIECSQFKTKSGKDVMPKTEKVTKTYMRRTGYIDQGHHGWYLVWINPTLVADIIVGVNLGLHIKAQAITITNIGVDHLRCYVYLDANKDIVTNFMQFFTITI